MKKCFLAILALSITLISQGQLVINEFMAGNTSTYLDNYGEYDDWIEIYNTGNTSVSLNGYYITDNFNNKLKFKLPATVSVAAKGYLVVIADDNGDQGNLHTNFKLSLDGEEIGIYKLSGADTILIDTLTFQAQSNDISYGRYPDGNEFFEFFAPATPGIANVSGNLEGVAPMPEFSIQGGFYTGPQSVTLSCELTGAQIRYTTDGSEPTQSSALYSTAITNDKTIIIKAKAFATNYVPSKTQAATYFIDEHFCTFNESERLPVISVSCNASNFESLVQSTDMEIMTNLEFFEPSGNTAINQYVGLKVFGNASRALEQKSLAAFARSKYSKGSFDYKFFDDKPFTQYESFVMRNGGSDWSLTYFRDGLCQAIVRNSMNIAAQASKHAILYVNGSFYGIVDLKEKVNENYLAQNFGANPDNVDMLMDNQTLIYGDGLKFAEFNNYLVNNDMSSPVLYKGLNKLMDIKGYMNIQIAQIYIANIDMFLNSKYWRERVNYGKWRWILYDTEIGFGQRDESAYDYTEEWARPEPYSNTLIFAASAEGGSNWPYLRPWSTEKLVSLLKNETFRNDFIQTFAVNINTTFKPSRVVGMIDSIQENISREIPYQIEKYGGHLVAFNPYGYHFTTVEEWEDYVQLMRDFANQRPGYMRSYIEDFFGLDGTYELTPTISNVDQGTVYIQGISVPVDSVGVFFDNIPLHIKAVAKEGYRFVKWQGLQGIDSLSADINVTVSENVTLKAVFTAEADVMISEVLYKPGIGGSEFIELHNPKHAGNIDLKKYAISGGINFTFPDSTYIAAGDYLVLVADRSKFDTTYMQVFQWTSGSLNDTSGIIVLKDSLGITVDSVKYLNDAPWPAVNANQSIELIAAELDNNLGNNWQTCISDGGSAGIPAFPEDIRSLVINEFMADNTDIIADDKGQCNDWIEILNPTDKVINFGGMFITNDLKVPAMYQIPVNNAEQTTIKPGEYKILWADDDKKQGANHLGFKLASAGGAIGLSADGKSFFDSVKYNQQTANVSLGRHADGVGNWRTFSFSTPGYKNSLAPVFTSEPVLYCEMGKSYTYNITATDEDGDDLYVSYYTKPYWSTFETTGNGTAVLTGTMPGGVTKVFSVKVIVTDGYTDPVIQEYKITRGLPPTGIFDESLANHQFTCYPNPTNGLVNVGLTTGSATAQLTITSVTGQIVMTRQLISSNNEIDEEIDLSGQKKGIYYITIKADEGTSTQKVILY